MPLLRLFEVWLNMIDYEKLDALAQKLMMNRKAHLNRERGFIYYHGKRTAIAVIALRKMATEDDRHDDALRIAAMFHDVGKGIEPHNRTGAAIVKELLAEELPPALLDEVARLIRAHVERPTEGIWEGLLQDADLMDHLRRGSR